LKKKPQRQSRRLAEAMPNLALASLQALYIDKMARELERSNLENSRWMSSQRHYLMAASIYKKIHYVIDVGVQGQRKPRSSGRGRIMPRSKRGYKHIEIGITISRNQNRRSPVPLGRGVVTDI
jgi:hypothetical protein